MKSMLSFIVAVVAASLPVIAAAPALAQRDMCRQLWVERNSIYKDARYCFKTSRAIRYFGNSGCRYDYEADVPLSGGERARVNRIRALEREYGCR
jgi:hypothetical protein